MLSVYPILGRISNAVVMLGAALGRAFCVPRFEWNASSLASDLRDLRRSNDTPLLEAYQRGLPESARLSAAYDAQHRAEWHGWRRF